MTATASKREWRNAAVADAPHKAELILVKHLVRHAPDVERDEEARERDERPARAHFDEAFHASFQDRVVGLSRFIAGGQSRRLMLARSGWRVAEAANVQP